MRTDTLHGRPKTHSGFTLLELLVTLAVLAIALGSLLQISGQHATNTAYLKQKTFAHWVAQNTLAQLHLENAWNSTGQRRTNVTLARQEWQVEVINEETEDEFVRKVTIRVYQADEPQQSVSHLISYLRSPQTRPTSKTQAPS